MDVSTALRKSRAEKPRAVAAAPDMERREAVSAGPSNGAWRRQKTDQGHFTPESAPLVSYRSAGKPARLRVIGWSWPVVSECAWSTDPWRSPRPFQGAQRVQTIST